MRVCANRTCDRPSRLTYCSEECKASTRNADHRRHVVDVRLDMSVWHRLNTEATEENITVRDLVLDLIHVEFGDPA